MYSWYASNGEARDWRLRSRPTDNGETQATAVCRNILRLSCCIAISVVRAPLEGLDELGMVAVVGVANDGLLDWRKLAFERIEPRRIGRRPDQMNVVVTTPASDLGSPGS